MGKKLYVGNLNYDVTDGQLESMFSAHGTVQSVQVIMDRDTGRSKGFGFVEMGSDAEAQAAITALNGTEVEGRALTVNEARPKPEGGGGRGGGGGGGGGRGGAGGGEGGRAGRGGGGRGEGGRAGGGLEVTYGARLEAARFTGAPPYNPAVDSLFGVRTDRIPRELHASPRIGFTWTVGGGGGGSGGAARFGEPPGTIVRGGVGDFRGLTPSGLYSAALGAPGLSNAETQLVCVGSAVPSPDWTQYALDPATIPSQCVDTATTITITPPPNATVFDREDAAAHAWRASLGVQRRVHGTYTVSVDAAYARGRSQYGFRDLNLVATPRFTLADEANRPVYVPADSIVPATGALSLQQSRVRPQFGQVIAIGSDLQADSRQRTLGFGGFTSRGATFQLSYTLTRARDQSPLSCCAATQGFAAPSTAGHPNVAEGATSR